MAGQSYAIGRLVLHPHRDLLDRGAPVPLGGRALDLLSVLAAANGGVISKDELIAVAWPGAIVEDNALQAQVSAVRKALGPEAARLVTIHGRGYRLDLGPRTEVAPEPARPTALVVFAFENLTGDAANDYLAAGIADELLSTLSPIPELVVPEFRSSLAYRGTGMDVRTIAREHGAATLLDGSLRKLGDRLQVTVELVDVATGALTWSHDVEGDLGHVIELLDELAGAIAPALGRPLAPRTARPTNNEAVRLFMQANRMGLTLNSDALRRAAYLGRKATALDPGYARAWHQLGGSLYLSNLFGATQRSALDEARACVERALTLDPACGSGVHTIRGGIAAMTGQWLEAEEAQSRGWKEERFTGARGAAYALQVLLPTGRQTAAAEVATETITFSAGRGYASLARAVAACLAGDFSTARRYLDALLTIGQPPRRLWFELALSEEAYARGAFDEACTPITAALAREHASPDTGVAIERVFAALGRRGDPAVASEAATALFEAGDRSGALWRHPDNAGPFMLWQVRLGNLDAAFAVARRIVARWRETGVLANSSLIPFWAFDLVEFRSDPRFQEIVGDLGLFPYWERHGAPDGHALRDGRLIVL